MLSAGEISAFEAMLLAFRTQTVRPLLIADALGIAQAHGVGGSVWTRTRKSGGYPVTAETSGVTSDQAISFIENHPFKAAQALPSTSIYAAPFWGIAALEVDVQENDVFDNGTIAFRIMGAPDTSQGFQRIPAALLPELLQEEL